MAFHDDAKDADLDAAYRAGLPDTGAVAGIKSEPEATGFDLLQQWIDRDPSFRVVDRMARLKERCIVELRGKLGVYSSTTQLTFDSAVRTAIMIAMQGGDR